MIGKVVKMATVKHQPTFEILPSEAGGCLVVVIWPNGPEQQLDGFSSVEAAQAWIENDGPSWIAGSLQFAAVLGNNFGFPVARTITA